MLTIKDLKNVNNKSSKKNIKPQKQVIPSLDLISIREKSQQPNDVSHRSSFNSFFKQIIDTKNENFLSGDINIIDYLISKYFNISTTQEEVKNLSKLSIKIQSDLGMLNQFGVHLPKLEELTLNGSIIPKIDDIGSNFNNLRVLNISNCFLEDLNGIICFVSLDVLDASFNLLSNFFDLEECNSLKRLNLSNNKIEREDSISALSFLFDLEELDLSDNPIAKLHNFKDLIKQYVSNSDIKLEFTYSEEDKLLNNCKSTRNLSTSNSNINMFENVDLFRGGNKKPSVKTDSVNSLSKSTLQRPQTCRNGRGLLANSVNTIQGIKSLISNRVYNDDTNLNLILNLKDNLKFKEGFENFLKIRDKSLNLAGSNLAAKINPDNKIVLTSFAKNKNGFKRDENTFKIKEKVDLKLLVPGVKKEKISIECNDKV